MSEKKYLSRREFLKTSGVVSAGTLAVPIFHRVNASADPVEMPTRPFGKAGINVPILSFGGSLHLPQLMLRQAFKWGVTYWDTANSYMGGNSEKRIGKYFNKYPQDRRKIFLVTKSHAWNAEGLSADLDQSLERMKTDYADLFFVHSLSGIDELDNSIKAWSQKKKAEGKFRLFGFSTHRNMEACMLGASKLGWIDAIMMSYNYRLMYTDEMKRAVDACFKSGIGLTAMKTQAGGSWHSYSEIEGRLVDRFLKRGFTDAQAKLKAVWENPKIASICSEMPNMDILMANVSAALNRTRLSAGDMNLLQRYAHATRADYCKGCAQLCETALNGEVPVSDIMRYLMYWRSYGDRHRAEKYFHQISAEHRLKMTAMDYTLAEQICPQQMAIGSLVRSALSEFSLDLIG